MHDQHHFNQQAQRRSGGGCGKVALIGGGCLAILVVGFVALILAGGLLWDRGTEAGGNWASSWLSDRYGSDISERADRAEEATEHLPEPQRIDGREDYVSFLQSYNREFAESMHNVAYLLSQPRLRDEEWSDDVAEQIAIIRHLEAQAREIEPPPDLEGAHSHWVAGMTGYRQAMDTTASALDNLSPSELVEAINALNTATQEYVSMARELEEAGVLETLEQFETLDEIDKDSLD